MNVFKKFYRDFLDRLHFDVKMRDRGVSFNVDLDPEKSDNEENNPSYVLLTARGLLNPVGGVLMCCLVTKKDIPGSCYIPQIANRANMFLFLNGKLLPDSAPGRMTLSEYVLGENLEEDLKNEEYRGTYHEIPLGDGYRLHYVYVHPIGVADFFGDCSETKTLIDFLHGYSARIFKDIEDPVFVKVNTTDDDDAEEDEIRDVIDTWRNDMRKTVSTSQEITSFGAIGRTDDASLIDELADYLYSNILEKTCSGIKDITKSPDAHDIPWTNKDNQQTKWLAKIKRSTKDEGAWDRVAKLFLTDWH